MSFRRAALIGQEEKAEPQALAPEERVRGLFLPDGRSSSVARPNLGGIGQHQEFLPNPAQKQITIATGQIPPPNATTKEHVTPHDHGILR